MGTLAEDLEPLFEIPSFYDMYITLNLRYQEMDFHDEISDSERISEYKDINTQLRKYITKQKNVILSCKKKEEALAIVENLVTKMDDYGDTRKEIVYAVMRDDFLLNLHRVIFLYQDNEDETEEEEE